MDKIIGSGGGGKSGGGGAGISEDPDTLASVATARILDLVCEGPIEGYYSSPNVDYSIYLDGVPLKDTSGTINYRPYTFQVTTGTASQGVLEGFANIQQENTVGLKITTGLGMVVRSIPDAGADAVRVTMAVNGLSSTDTSGKIGGTSLQYEVYTRVAAGTWRLSIANTISEKTRSRAQVQHEVLLGDLGAGPYEVAVKRITTDSASSLLVNDLFWDAFTIVNYEKLNYPNSVLCGVTIDARYFTNIPTRSYHVRGLIIPVPANCVDSNGRYDRSYKTTGTGTTNGAWNGTFVNAWCDNPAWCLLDLLTNKRYGLGRRLFGDADADPVNGGLFAPGVDKWTFYQVAKYCDEAVPTGYTGSRIGYIKPTAGSTTDAPLAGVAQEQLTYEPRFRLNCVINTLDDAYKTINQICSVFRGMAYWSSGMVTLSQDAPGPAQAIYTNANVVDGEFTYQGSARGERHTSIIVAWNDPSEDFVRKYEYIEDSASIARYGYRPTEVAAFGCTSKAQARRYGRSIMLTERLDTEMITFKVGSDIGLVKPGALVSLVDNDRIGTRWGGRIGSISVNRFKASEDLTSSPWTVTGGTIVANSGTVAAPDGALTADTMMETAVTSGHYLEYVHDYDATKEWTLSFYTKAVGRTVVGAAIFDRQTTSYVGCDFDLTAVTTSPFAGALATELLATITAVGSLGWYRCTLSGVPGANATNNGTRVQIGTKVGGTGTFLGDVTKGVMVWGVQFEPGLAAGAYMKTTTTAAAARVFFDVPPVVPSSGSYTLSCMVPAGSLESVPVTFSVPGAQAYADVGAGTGFSVPPNLLALWSLTSTTVTPQTARVVSIREEGTNVYTVNALASNQSKYAAIDIGAEVTDGNYSFLTVGPPAQVTGLVVTEYAYKATIVSLVRSDVIVSWDRLLDPTIRGYEVKSVSGFETVRYPETKDPRITLNNIPAGNYVISVVAVNYLGIKGATPASYALTVLNVDTSPPAQVTGLTYAVDSVSGVRLSWTAVADFIDYYEIRVGATYAGSTLVAKVSATSFQVGSQVAGNYTYWLAAVDTSGNVSTTKSSVGINLTVPTAVVVSGTVSAGNEVLSWNTPASLITIDRYEIRRGATWATALFEDTTKGTSWTRPVSYSGSRTYLVAAIDAVGNVGASGSTTITSSAPSAPTLTLALVNGVLRLAWTASTGTLPVSRYEVRYGASYAAGTQVFSGDALSMQIAPNWVGSRVFWVAAYDTSGTQGAIGSAEFIVVAPGAVTSSRIEVVDNNALLYWSAPATGTLPLDRYEVRKGASFAAGTVIGSNATSTFASVFEQQGGMVNYWVAAFDIAGNAGPATAIVGVINQPPDYVLNSDLNSTFNGTLTNLVLTAGQLVGPINAIESAEQHFSKSLLASASDFSSWTLTLCSITPDTAADAGGFTTADQVTRTTTGDSLLYKTYTTTSHANNTFTFSVWMKSGTMTGTVDISLADGAGTAIGAAANCTLTTTLTRFTVTATVGASPAANLRVVINPTVNTGTIGETFVVADAQLVQAASAASFWRTVTDQTSAGFALYAQPALTTGSYQETIDYGTDMPTTQVTAILLSTALAGTVTTSIQLEYKKAADPSWTAAPAGISSYLASGGLRYLRVTVNLSGAGGANLIALTGLNVKLNLKLKSDSRRGTTTLGGAHTQGNLVNYRAWTPGTSLPAGWATGTDLAGENVIVSESGPGGVTQNIFRCVQITPAVATWDGYYLSTAYAHDNTQVYLHAVFMTKLTSNGSLYFGPGDGSFTANLFADMAGADYSNPYFVNGSATLLTAGTWYLAVGLVHELGYAGGQTTISGVYDLSGARQTFTVADITAKAGLTQTRTRAGMFGNNLDASGTVTAKMARPMVIKTTRAAAPALIQKIIKDATAYGLEMAFGSQFLDVRALTATPLSSLPVTTVVDFVDVPNPLACNVYAFDSAGNRIAQEVSLQIRGV